MRFYIDDFSGSRLLQMASRPLPEAVRTLELAGKGLILRQSQLQQRLHAELEMLKPVALSKPAPHPYAKCRRGRAPLGALNLCETGLET